jgi:hypothetical protein
MTTREDLSITIPVTSPRTQNTLRTVQERRNNHKFPDNSTAYKIEHQPRTRRVRNKHIRCIADTRSFNCAYSQKAAEKGYNNSHHSLTTQGVQRCAEEADDVA